MKNPCYLTLSRHNIYYFRYPLPAMPPRQQSIRDIRLSLGTRCPREALRLSRVLTILAAEKLNELVAAKMDYIEIRDALTRHFRASLERQKDKIHKSGPLLPSRVASYQRSIQEYSDALKYDSCDITCDDDEVNKTIERLGLPIEPSSAIYETFRCELVKSRRDFWQSLLEFNAGFNHSGLVSVMQSLPTMQQGIESRKKLSSSIDAYISEKLRLGAWGDKSVHEFKAQFNLLLEYVGQDAWLEMSSDTANAVKKMLLGIPKYSRSKPRFKAMTIQQREFSEQGHANRKDGKSQRVRNNEAGAA